MVTNTLGYYDPALYANEALIWLTKGLGMAPRVHMGFDAERRTFDRGSVINIKRPATFTAQSAPGTADDTVTESVQISLDQWQEVRFQLSDKEMAYGGDRLVTDHIMPAAYALADKIDQDLCALTAYVPHIVDTAASTAAVADILNVKKTMFNNRVPLSDESNIHFMIGGQEEADLLALSAFSQWQGAGATGERSQIKGTLGQRFGFNFFTNQNRWSSGAYFNLNADQTGALSANAAQGATTMSLDGFTAAEELKKGLTFKVTTGSVDYYYTVTSDASAFTDLGGGNYGGSVSISPPARVAHGNNDVVVLTGTFDNLAASTPQALAFHRDAFALAMAKLPDYQSLAPRLGIQAASVQDPVTGLSVRSRIQYIPASSAIEVVLDVLYGVKTLNADLACRMVVV